MGVADLIRALERDAEAQSAACLERAQAQAEAVREAADREAALRRRDILGREEKRLRTEGRRRLVDARARALRATLGARERVLERIFATAAVLLRDAPTSASYRQTLQADIEEALSYIGARPASVVCPHSLEEAVRALVCDRSIRIRAETGAEPGILVVTDDGVLTVDNTLTARLQRLRPTLASKLVKRLGIVP